MTDLRTILPLSRFYRGCGAGRRIPGALLHHARVFCFRRHTACGGFSLGFAVAFLLGLTAAAQAIHGRGGITLPPPPDVQKIPVTDNYFGTKASDNYRWLEDAKSPETQAFIDAENAYTARYMEQARIRPQVADDLDALEQCRSGPCPSSAATIYFFEKRLAGEEQSSIYVRQGWAGKDGRLIDPAQFSRDPNTSVSLRGCFARRLAGGV